MNLLKFVVCVAVFLSVPPSFATAMTVRESLSVTQCQNESAFGNLVADAARKASLADVTVFDCQAFAGVGEIAQGVDVTAQDVVNLLGAAPRNIYAEQISGAKLLLKLEQLVADTSSPHVAGLRMVVDPAQKPGMRIAKITVSGEALQLDKIYRVAMLQPVDMINAPITTLQSALQLELQSTGLMRARTYGRVKFLQ